MKAVIIDDEAPARFALSELIDAYCPQVTITGMAENGEEGLHLIQTTLPDIVFLDIEMPGGSGFDMLQNLPEINFHLVFVSAFNHYAFRAFEFSALDYLEKPVSPPRLIKCVHKAASQTQLHQLQSQFDLLTELIERKDVHDHRIVFATQSDIVFSWLSNLIRIDADANFSMIKLSEIRDPIRIAKNIGDYEKLLTGYPQMMRIHRSHLINLFHVQKFIREEDSVQMTDGFKIPVATVKREELLERLGSLGGLR